MLLVLKVKNSNRRRKHWDFSLTEKKKSRQKFLYCRKSSEKLGSQDHTFFTEEAEGKELLHFLLCFRCGGCFIHKSNCIIDNWQNSQHQVVDSLRIQLSKHWSWPDNMLQLCLSSLYGIVGLAFQVLCHFHSLSMWMCYRQIVCSFLQLVKKSW